MRIALGAAFLFASSFTAQAALPKCQEANAMLAAILKEYKESVVAIGQIDPKTIIVVTSDDGGDGWTVLTSSLVTGQMCVLVAGKGLMSFEIKPKGRDA